MNGRVPTAALLFLLGSVGCAPSTANLKGATSGSGPAPTAPVLQQPATIVSITHNDDEVFAATIKLVGSLQASAFIVRKDDRLYLVTAAHVANSAKPHWEVHLQGASESNAVCTTLGKIVHNKSKLDWVLAKFAADVAVVRLDPKASDLTRSTYRTVDYFKELLAGAKKDPLKGVQLFWAGFPFPMPTCYFEPIPRGGSRVQTELLETPVGMNQKIPVVYVSTAAGPGFSGAAVFERREGILMCVGVWAGDIPPNFGGYSRAHFVADAIVDLEAGGR